MDNTAVFPFFFLKKLTAEEWLLSIEPPLLLSSEAEDVKTSGGVRGEEDEINMFFFNRRPH